MTDISGWIARRADAAPDAVAIHFEGADISYRALDERVAAAAAMLAGPLGVARGDRIAFLGCNRPDFIVLLFACARLGAIMVPLNWRLAAPELLYILRDSGVSALFVEAEFAAVADALRGDLQACRLVGFDGAGGWRDFDALMVDGAGRGDPPRGSAGADDALLIVYTSGTTGRPKGAVLSQNALTVNALNSAAAHDMTSADIALVGLPMFHVGGLNILATPALHCGATVILHRRFDPDATVAAIRRHRPALMTLVPAMMQAMIDHPAWPELDLSCLRCLGTGSTVVPRPLLDAWLARVPVIQIYGSTETAPFAIHQRIADARRSAGSTGKPALHCEARVVDAAGNETPPGETGEIVVRSANVMTRYWNDPDATAKVLRGGWFHTGDAGHVDSDGNFHVDDRIGDVIISGSENVYPAEIEAVLYACPDIAEAAAVGRPDARWGEVPVAFVVRRPGSSIASRAILELFDGRLARFKHPREVIVVDALPRNAMGKVLKFELRERLLDSRGGGP